jgi:hypothetical protein
LLIGLFAVLLLNFLSSLYILNNNSWPMSIWHIFSHPLGCVFTLFLLLSRSFFYLMQSHLSILALDFYYYYYYFGGIGVWNQGLMLARQVLYHLSDSASPYCSYLLSY